MSALRRMDAGLGQIADMPTSGLQKLVNLYSGKGFWCR